MKTRSVIFFLCAFLISLSFVNAQSQIRFVLVNADADTDIRVLQQNETVTYSNTSHISIRAEYIPDPSRVQVVEFSVDNDPFHSENLPPYAIRGDRNGDYLPYDPGVNQAFRSITAKIWLVDTVASFVRETIRLYFVDNSVVTPNVPSIESFILVDAETDQDIQVLTNGSIIRLNQLPHLNIRVTGNIPSAGSVVFSVNTIRNYRTENKAPYAVYGDIEGDFNEGFLGPYDSESVGAFTATITATPYSGPNGSGVSGTPVTISLNVLFGPRTAMRQAVAYPNPASGQVTISTDGNAELEVCDLTGKIYYRGTVTSGTQQTVDLDQIFLSEGIYFIRLVYPDKREEVMTLLKK